MEDANDELERPVRALAFSGLFAGFTIGASPLVVAVALTLVDDPTGSGFLVAQLLYPIGFVAVIIGRAQFFTENTLYPVVATLDDRRHLVGTLRLWAVVLATNLAGGLAFAALALETGALPSDFAAEFGGLGEKAAEGGFWSNFWGGVLAGWLLALVAWLVEATEAAVGQVLVIALLTLPIGLATLDHSVATAIEVMGGWIEGAVDIGEMLRWLAAAVAGNVVGGVVIVTLLNYGQVRSAE